MDYYILFRDLDDPTPIDYVKRRFQEDLLIADRASYVWGYIGELNDDQIRVVRARLVWENAKRYYEAGNSLGASGLTKYVFEIEIGTIEPETLDFLAKLPPNLAFLSGVSPNHRFLFYPESDEESLRINQALSSISEQNRDFSWNMSELDFPKIHSTSVQALPLSSLMDIWKRVGCCPHMDILRHTAAILDIEATINPSLRKKPEKTLNLSSSKLKSISPAEAQKIFKSVALDKEKYISTLPPRQLKVLGECVEMVNGIRTADGCGIKNIENIYGAMKVNVGHSAPRSLMQAASSQGASPIILDGQFTELIDEPDEIPHIFSAPSGRFTPDVIIDGSTMDMEIGDTIGNPLHTSESPDSPLIEILKEQNEILKERLPLPTTETEPAKKQSELKIPGAKIDYEKVITELYESRPETQLFDSSRLLAYLKGLRGGENVNISDDRIRQLKVWKKYRAARESGKEQYWGDMGNVTTEKKLVKERKIPGDSQ
jgi:hypothetical protein